MEKNPVKRYSLFLSLQFVVVIAVILIFRLIEDRAIGGLVAGAVFVTSTLLVLMIEWRAERKITWALAGALVFYVGGVLPILILRAISWGANFNASEMIGLSGKTLHQSSSLFFLVYLIGLFVSLQKARMKTKENDL